MTLQEVIAEIKSKNKPYAGINMPQGTFTNTLKSIEWGFAKPKTIEAFLETFGHNKIVVIEQWEKR